MNVAKSLNPMNFFQSGVDDNDEDSSSSEGESAFHEDEELNDQEKAGFASRVNLGVNVSRGVVMVVLLAAGAATSTLTYKVMQNEQENDFEMSYELFVSNIKDSGTAQITSTVQALYSLSEDFTASSIASNSTFPFVTVPLVEVLCGYARQLSGLEMITFTPLVLESERTQYEAYATANQGWVEESREIVGQENVLSSDYLAGDVSPILWENKSPCDSDSCAIPAINAPFLPIWQTSPPPFWPGLVGYNMNSELFIQNFFGVMQETRSQWLTEVLDLSRLGAAAVNTEDHNEFHGQFVDLTANQTGLSGFSNPHSVILFPVFEKLADPFSRLVGMLHGILPWDYYLLNLLPEGVTGVYAVLENSCDQSYTYMLNGTKATYLGEGDLHEEKYDYMRQTFVVFAPAGIPAEIEQRICTYQFQLYPSKQLDDQYVSNLPVVMSIIVASTFAVMAIAFFVYDRFVRVRNDKVEDAAIRSNKIVSSLFPSNVRDRLLAEEEEAEKLENKQQHGTQTRLKNFLANDGPADGDMETDDIMYKTKPIADLFPETTILFADISGFTAWSSAREPSQVFTLLETVYRAFDEIAKRRRVFKVETVGDCYVAATGLPEPRMDHAVAMARFARDCMYKMQALTRKLEVSLGPDTADLAMRMGMHSGPVTAGVLRGERSRFQLFGDTMNTASRMESTGVRDRIQVSQDTADLLIVAGKKSWISQREDIVIAKGKGEMRTFWLDVSKGKTAERAGSGAATEEISGDASVSSDDMTEAEEEPEVMRPTASAKIARLIDWNVDVLLRLLKTIVAHRIARGKIPGEEPPTNEDFSRSVGKTVLDEVEERICLPGFEPAVSKQQLPPEKIELDSAAESQLYEYVAAIAAMYRDNPFHNFEHASHVTMSVSKLLSRIIAPSDIDFQSSEAKNQTLHDHTYGITSDPLTQFSCVLSALIHDVDHTGVPNTQLALENPRMSEYYKGRSIAEQNSVDVAWDLLCDECYTELRGTIYTTEDELKRFRMLVVNSVMATDIMDKDLKVLRNERWDRAFAVNAQDDDPLGTVQRKATIVIEHLIQASDVAHTMQHWHIYRKWNSRLFEELYKAYVEGRAEKNPAEFWYKGEMGFFDFYIIPLAKKLKDCGVFGVSSDEYLNYAEKNRKEWEVRGQEAVSELVEHVSSIYKLPPGKEIAQEAAPSNQRSQAPPPPPPRQNSQAQVGQPPAPSRPPAKQNSMEAMIRASLQQNSEVGQPPAPANQNSQVRPPAKQNSMEKMVRASLQQNTQEGQPPAPAKQNSQTRPPAKQNSMEKMVRASLQQNTLEEQPPAPAKQNSQTRPPAKQNSMEKKVRASLQQNTHEEQPPAPAKQKSQVRPPPKQNSMEAMVRASLQRNAQETSLRGSMPKNVQEAPPNEVKAGEHADI